MSKVNIHGKEYTPVVDRVNTFRADDKHSGWAIITEIVSNDNEFVVMKASIVDDKDRTLATGHAQEKYGSTNINQTSALENCETSAIGRALASYGMAGTEFASADEVATAIKQQNEGVEIRPKSADQGSPATDKQKKFLYELYLQQSPDGDVIDYIRGEGFEPDSLTIAQASQLIKDLQGE